MNSNNQPQPLPGHNNTSNNEVSETSNQNQHSNAPNTQESHSIEPTEIKNWLNQILKSVSGFLVFSSKIKIQPLF